MYLICIRYYFTRNTTNENMKPSFYIRQIAIVLDLLSQNDNPVDGISADYHYVSVLRSALQLSVVFCKSL